MSGASGRQRADRSFIKKLKIKIPDLETQEKIANILSIYDKLIENNNKRIELLEKTAEEIYKEWFIRMRFSGHENTKFVKGVPEGWEVKRIKDIGKVITGKTPSTKNPKYYGQDIMFVKTPDMKNSIFTTSSEITLSIEGSESQINKLIPKDSIMVSCIGTGGVVSINTEPAHTNQQINSIVLNNKIEREWSYFTLRSMKKTIELFGATGATMTNLSKGKFEKLKILYPSLQIMEEFHSKTMFIFESIKKIILVNQNLIKQRDLLLPRLMNGTIEVK
jgi:type I restriction enzyme S subunit